MGQETLCGPVVRVQVADKAAVPRSSPALTTSCPTSWIGRICFTVDLINLFTSFIYQLFWTQANPEGCARTGLRSRARCHPYPIPQPVKVGHTTGVYDPYSFRKVMWVLLRPTRTKQGKCCVRFFVLIRED